jgi:hypothetical protein
MIDWVTAIIPCRHPEKIFGGNVISITNCEWRRKREFLSVKSLSDQTLFLDENPSKWQGHNLFGSSAIVFFFFSVYSLVVIVY